MSDLQRVANFVIEIGLWMGWERGAHGFCAGLLIEKGRLLVDPDVCPASTLLHEAGHLAITPGRYRHIMSGDLKSGLRAMWDDALSMNLELDDPLMRAVVQVSDPEATAWTWAAGLAIGLPPDKIIQGEEYDGSGDEVRAMLTPSVTAVDRVTGYVGIHGLAHAGMTALHSRGPVPMYPKMARWLQIY